MNLAELSYAKRFDGVSGSAIRDILKLLGVPGMISFAGGNPAESALEDSLIADMARDVMQKHGKKLLQYGATEGFAPYRAEVAGFLKAEIGIDADETHILPTTGSTQAIDLLLKALIDEGDTVLVEGPSFLGTLQAMKLYGAKLVSVPMDGEGIRLDALEEAVRAHKPKLLYTVPNFQNPTGVTLSLARRQAIADMASKYNFVIAEDDPYRGLRYAGNPLPTIYSFDREGRTVYLTSFSKLISPGLRVGAAVTPNPVLLRKLTVGKQSADVHTPSLVQAIAAEYLSRGLLPDHMEAICGRYRAQLSRMLDALSAFPEGVTCTRPDGGLFVWVELPKRCDAVRMLRRAIDRGVAYVPGTYFYTDGGHLNTLRLNFSSSEPETIDKGMDILKACIREEE